MQPGVSRCKNEGPGPGAVLNQGAGGPRPWNSLETSHPPPNLSSLFPVCVLMGWRERQAGPRLGWERCMPRTSPTPHLHTSRPTLPGVPRSASSVGHRGGCPRAVSHVTHHEGFVWKPWLPPAGQLSLPFPIGVGSVFSSEPTPALEALGAPPLVRSEDVGVSRADWYPATYTPSVFPWGMP